MLEHYEKDIKIVQNDDIPNSFEVSYKDFGIVYHLGYHTETNFDFYFSKTDEYKLFKNFAISFSPIKAIEWLKKVEPNLAKDLNINDDFNTYGNKKLTSKNKKIIRYIYAILFAEQVNHLIEGKKKENLRPEILDLYLHLLSFDSMLNILEENAFERSDLKRLFGDNARNNLSNMSAELLFTKDNTSCNLSSIKFI